LKKHCLIACAAVMTAAQFFAVAANAQPVTRVKAKLVAFDGAVMTLERLPPLMKSETPPPGGAASEAPTLTVSLIPETRFAASEKSAFAAIGPGDYVGAVVVEGRGGWLKAQEVYRYAPALRGTGEGRFTDNNRLLVNGTVTRADAPPNSAGGTLTLHYRGAVLNGAGKGHTVCEGRATPAPFASALACSDDAVVEVVAGTPVMALTLGDRNLLVPGSIVTVSITKLADRTVAPGVIVEAPSGLLEKPQSRP
jgi:hypothetical protein